MAQNDYLNLGKIGSDHSGDFIRLGGRILLENPYIILTTRNNSSLFGHHKYLYHFFKTKLWLWFESIILTDIQTQWIKFNTSKIRKTRKRVILRHFV